MTIQADLEHAHTSATQILDGLPSALAALHDAAGTGYPAKASGAARSGGHGALVVDPTDPTDRGSHIQLTGPEQLMEAQVEGRGDLALADLRTIEHNAMTARRALATVAATIAKYQRPAPLRLVTDADTAELYCPDDWCSSCYRDNQHHTPITLRRTGEPWHAGLCKWCGDFKREHGALPTLAILRARHAGKRITSKMIDAQKPVKPTRPTKSKRRKR